MVYIGMIFQFDSTQGSGLIMLTDGEKKEFTINEWIDSVNTPAIGQKISYESNGYQVQIKVASEEDEINTRLDEETKSSKEEASTDTTQNEFTSVDDAINYFTGRGFKLVKDLESDGSRTLTLRMFADGGALEVVITQSASNISVAQTVNGKPVKSV